MKPGKTGVTVQEEKIIIINFTDDMSCYMRKANKTLRVYCKEFRGYGSQNAVSI